MRRNRALSLTPAAALGPHRSSFRRRDEGDLDLHRLRREFVQRRDQRRRREPAFEVPVVAEDLPAGGGEIPVISVRSEYGVAAVDVETGAEPPVER